METKLISNVHLMSKIIIFVIFFASTIFGQSVKDEIKELKEFLSLSEKTEIKLGQDYEFQKGKNVKVFLAFGLDTQIYKNFNQWIDEWNKKDGKKYLMLEKVNEISQAEIIIARYTKKDKISSETNSRVATQMSYDPKTMTTKTTPVQQTYSISVVPVMGYLLKPNGENIDILERYSDTASASDTSRSGKDLWENLKTKLKRSK